MTVLWTTNALVWRAWGVRYFRRERVVIVYTELNLQKNLKIFVRISHISSHKVPFLWDTHFADIRSIDADRKLAARAVDAAVEGLPEVKPELHQLLRPHSCVSLSKGSLVRIL